MSLDAMAWVIQYSQEQGTSYALHLMVADSVNDDHDLGFWLRPAKLAVKARCSRETASRWLWSACERGLLECVEDNRLKVSDGRRNVPSLFRFLTPDLPVAYDKKGHLGRSPSVTTDHAGDDSLRDDRSRSSVTTDHASCVTTDHAGTTSKTTREEPQAAADAAASVRGEESEGGDPLECEAGPPREQAAAVLEREAELALARRLCAEIARRWAERSGSNPVKVSPTSVREMDLLLRRGPREYETPTPVPAHKVESMINLIFTEGATPKLGSDFYWAKQMQSGRNLREKWTKLVPWANGILAERRERVRPTAFLSSGLLARVTVTIFLTIGSLESRAN